MIIKELQTKLLKSFSYPEVIDSSLVTMLSDRRCVTKIAENMLQRREECDTYQTHVCRYPRSLKDKGENRSFHLYLLKL